MENITKKQLENLGFELLRETTMQKIVGGNVFKYNIENNLFFISNHQGIFELPTINTAEKIEQFIALLTEEQ
jgi:hypothetical protein